MIAEQLWEKTMCVPSQSRVAALKSRAIVFVLTDGESAVIAQERKRKSGRGWCSELIAGIVATTLFPGLTTLAKIATVFSPIVGMFVRMGSENSR
jgi:hypothetical protein